MIGHAGKNILIDTHCHLNDPSFEVSMEDVLGRSRGNGVVAFIVPAYDRASLPTTLRLAQRYPGEVFPAFGIHPWFVEGETAEELEHYLRCRETVAVGEIGLDFAPGTPAVEVQERTFTGQLDMAARLGLPVLIHCRKAHNRIYDILAAYKGRIEIVMHSFSASAEVAQRFLDLGCYISFSGSVTRETAKKYHRCARRVPLNRLLLETDAPSIATQTTVASRVEPWHTVEVAKKIAELKGLSYEEICNVSAANALKVFGLEKAGLKI